MTYGDTVDILRATDTTDRYSNTVPGAWSTSTADVPAVVQPADSTETLVDRDTVVTRYRLHCGPAVDILPTDRVLWNGVTFDVDGDLERHSRKGTAHHIEAFLKASTG